MNLRGNLIIILAALCSFLARGEQWRLHPTYDGIVDRLIDTKDYIYVLSNNQVYIENGGAVWADNVSLTQALFRYDKDGDEFEALTRQNELSGITVNCIEYDPEMGCLAIGYDDGNIDLLYDNGTLINVPGLKIADSSYSKKINSLSFIPESNRVLASTDFGYVSINGKTGDIIEVKNWRTGVKNAVCLGDRLIIIRDGKLYQGGLNSNKIEDFVEIPGTEEVRMLRRLSSKRALAITKTDWNGELHSLDLGGSGIEDKILFTNYFVSMEPSKRGVSVNGMMGLWDVEKEGGWVYSAKSVPDYGAVMTSWNGSDFVVTLGREGVVRRKLDSQSGEWTTTGEGMLPNASNAFKSTAMVYHDKYGMLVRNHGIDTNFSSQMMPTPDLISGLKGLEWTPLSQTYRLGDATFNVWNPDGIAVDPQNKDHVYCGSFGHGLLRLDLQDPSKSLRLGKQSEAGNPGFVPVQKNMGYDFICRFSAPGFDRSGNLWTAWYDYDLNEKKQDALEFWYWTPEDRASSKDVNSFRPFKKMKIAGVSSGAKSKLLPLTHSSNRNMLFYYNGDYDREFLLLDHKGTPENSSDDERMSFRRFSDQEGSPVSFDYVKCIYEDPSTGWVWCGMDKGVFYFKPSEMIKDASKVYRPLVARNDGTIYADYLLDGVSVNSIAEDNLGRKWFGTGGGGLVCTSNDGKEVLASYNTENSELPDNTLYAVCYNPENNSIMMSTNKGIAEMYLSSAAGGDSNKSSVVAYPNPVRPDYFGYVTITGLEDNALVKIVDSGGYLIKEVGLASGGEIRWDATNLNSKRVPSGVYYIMASGTSDGSSFSNVGKILVVN